MIGRYILIYQNKSINYICNQIKLDKYHEFLHRILFPYKNPRSFILDILNNPSKILLFDGSMKTNLQLLSGFINKKVPSQINKMKNDQKILYNFMKNEPKEWKELLEFDPNTFKQLIFYLKLEIKNEMNFDNTMLDLLRIVEKNIQIDKPIKNKYECESSSIIESEIIENNKNEIKKSIIDKKEISCESIKNIMNFDTEINNGRINEINHKIINEEIVTKILNKKMKIK